MFHQLGTTIGCSLCFVEVHYGFGKHIQFLNEYELRQFRKYTFGEWIQTFATLMWTKVSICLFLIRIPNNQKIRTAMYWCVGFLVISNTVLTVMWIMSCQPVRTAWYGEGICMSKHEKEAIIMTQAVISIVSDFSLAAFPIFYFWRLQVDLKTKVGLCLLMCLGVITGVCCIVRTVLNGEAMPVDETYDGIVNWIWRLFEVQFGIIAACIPTLRPFYKRMAAMFKGEKPPLADSNIKFLHSEKEQQQRWIEHKKDKHNHARGFSDSDSSSNSNLNDHNNDRTRKHTLRLPGATPRHADDMRQDLVDEGILTSDAHKEGNVAEGGDHKDDLNKRGTTSSADLETEMHKYGIPDDGFSSTAAAAGGGGGNPQSGTTHATPMILRDGFEGVSKGSGDQRDGPNDARFRDKNRSGSGSRGIGEEGKHVEGVGLEWRREGGGSDEADGIDWNAATGHVDGDVESGKRRRSSEVSSDDDGWESDARRGIGLQEALDEDYNDVGPMQAAKEWEPVQPV